MIDHIPFLTKILWLVVLISPQRMPMMMIMIIMIMIMMVVVVVNISLYIYVYNLCVYISVLRFQALS